MNTVIRNAQADYSSVSKYIYSKAYKLALGYVKQEGGNSNFISLKSAALFHAYLHSDRKISLDGTTITLCFNAQSIGGAANAVIFDAVDSVVKRRIKVKAYTYDDAVRYEISYITATGTKKITGGVAGNGIISYRGLYVIDINTLDNTIRGRYFFSDINETVYDTNVTNSFWSAVTTEATKFDDADIDRGHVYTVTDGITIGKTTLDDSNNSQCARLCCSRLSVDGKDLCVLMPDDTNRTFRDWVNNELLQLEGNTVAFYNAPITNNFYAFDKANTEL